jgi:hypothetical protein
MNSHRLVVRIKYIIALVLLMLLDIVSIPITAGLGLYIVLFKPNWFIAIVDNLYYR